MSFVHGRSSILCVFCSQYFNSRSFTGKRDEKIPFTCSLESSCRFGSFIKSSLEDRLDGSGVALAEYDLFHIAVQRGYFGKEQYGNGMRTDSPQPEDFSMISFYHGPESDLGVCEVLVAAAQGDPAATYISMRPREHHLSSEKSFNQAIKWLDDCLKSHIDCHPSPTITVMMPSRLIDVSFAGAGGRVRIVDTEGIPTRYAALTYCWGQIRQYQKLQLSNHTAWTSQGVLLDQLPRTIQDAVTVTRGLKLSYLWVDALCIIQDSNKDKEKELKHMHSVYENSYVTISIVDRDGSEGFLDMQHGPITTIPYPLPNGQIGNLELEIDPFFDPDLSKIELRAWTLQERLLSPRILYYSNDPSILAWDCATLLDAHGGDKPCRGLKPLHWALGRLHKRVTMPQQLDDSDNEVIAEIHAEWRGLASQFTRRDLSFEHDTFHALASLATKFHAALPPDHIYAAGLWLDPSLGYRNFVYSLCWFAFHDELCHTREYVAPSWSWASIRGPLFVNSPYGVPPEPMCSVMRYCPKLKSLDLPYGQLLEGTFLELRGVLRQVRASVITSEQEEEDGREEEDSNEEKEEEATEENDQGEHEDQYPQLNGCSFDTKEIAPQRENDDSLWYLLLSEDGGLVLDCVSGPGVAKRVFKRIGVTTDVIGSVDWNEGKNLETVILI